MKILICGDIHAGKSTLIRRLLQDMDCPVRGYITVRMPEENGVSRVYLYDAAKEPENIRDSAVIIKIENGEYTGYPMVLDTLGTSMIENIPAGSTVVLDEIGTLESRAPEFCKAIMRILDGDYTVLASVKAQNTDFLRAVRRHPACELYIITPENRDSLYRQIKEEYGI